jgi:hypothetical protein
MLGNVAGHIKTIRTMFRIMIKYKIESSYYSKQGMETHSKTKVNYRYPLFQAAVLLYRN